MLNYICFGMMAIAVVVGVFTGRIDAVTEAAIDGELPRFLGHEHRRYGTPVGSAVVMGIITTAILAGYGLIATSNEDLFWDLFASSAVLFLLPYIGAIGAFLYMRVHDADRPRPFRVPGGMFFASLVTLVCIGLLLMTVLVVSIICCTLATTSTAPSSFTKRSRNSIVSPKLWPVSTCKSGSGSLAG